MTAIRNELYKELQIFGISAKLINLMGTRSTNTTAKVRIQNKSFEEFEIKEGLRQGNSYQY